MGSNRRYSGSEYVGGNTARKLNAVPAFEEERRRRHEYQQEQERKKRQRRRIKSRARTQGLDLVMVLFLTAAIAITAYVCSGYLSVQADILAVNKQTASLEREIAALKSENAVARGRVEEYLDLSYVYEVATKELGMVHAKENQVVPYKSTKSDLVRQYGDIPAGKNGNSVNGMLGK